MKYLNIVQWLYENGADADVIHSNHRGWTPFLLACQNNNLEIVQFLVLHGAVASVATSSAPTAMFLASQNNHLEIVKYLYDHLTGAKLEVTRSNSRNETPLWVACQQGHLKMARWLVNHGAKQDVKRPAVDGSTPIIAACFEKVILK